MKPILYPLRLVFKSSGVLSKNIIKNLKDFKCDRNPDIQDFVTNNMIDAENSGDCRSYLYISREKET
jgi:hypothetical protein